LFEFELLQIVIKILTGAAIFPRFILLIVLAFISLLK
jgi:hypothetical protein